MQNSKICKTCLKRKPLTEFYKHPKMRDGRFSSCKKCEIEYSKMHHKLPEVVEKIKKYKAKYYKTQKHLAAQKRWRNSEKCRLYQKSYLEKWSKTTKGKMIRQKNLNKFYSTEKGKELRRISSVKRRALIRGAICDISKEQIRTLISGTKFCPHCGIKLGKNVKVHLDHIVPLSKGGSHTIYNVQILCDPCNRRKHTKPNHLFNGGQIMIGLS